jgi:hypothetical protein
MERYIFLGVLFFTLIALGIGMLLPGKPVQDAELYLPWQIEKTVKGSSRVFGLELGTSTLLEAQNRFRELYEVSLFSRDDGDKVVEVYFDSITLSGLRARVVLVMDLTPEQLNGFYERGVRIATMGSGGRKVTLDDADLLSLASMPIASLTYIPKSQLNAELVQARFGTPAERIREKDSESIVEHWLYPHYGLDLILNEKGKEVLQYIQPERFDSLRKPLIEKGGIIVN